VSAGYGIDELRRNADLTAAPPDAALQHVAGAQLTPDLPDIDRLALVLEGAGSTGWRSIKSSTHR